jgi:hypothetical protein
MEQRPWHRLFGLSWMDFFRGTAVQVEMERDLSVKQQLLDVLLICARDVVLPRRLPDGFDLAAYNLVSFRSYQDSLDGWILNELVGHFVNLRKQVSPSMQDLLPETDFRLFAVVVRFPHKLAKQVELHPIQPGVYEVRHFSGIIRIVVVHEMPQEEHNAMLHLFSAKDELLRYGAEHYRPYSEDTSTLLYELFETYHEEGKVMPDQLEIFARETIEKMLKKLSPEERLKGLPPEDRLKGLPPEELRKHLSAEERLKGLPPEERLKGLSTDELLAGLSSEAREALARRITEK